MVGRIWFILVALFFVVMNILLWRNEVRGRSDPGGLVPVDIVWSKVLTAPDDSSLEIRRHNRKIGFLHWVPNVGGELATGKVMREDLPPEGMVQQVTNYSLDLDGNLFEANEEGMRFHTHLQMSTNHLWEQLNLRLNFRQTVYQVEADAAREEVSLRVEAEGQQSSITWGREELRDPRALLRQLGGPLAELMVQWDLVSSLSARAQSAPKITWTARHDWLKVGHARIKVYRVHVRVLDGFEAVGFVSPVGEILRVELPGEIVLINDAIL